MTRPLRLTPDPIDADGTRRRAPSWPKVPVRLGMVVEHRASGAVGAVVELGPDRITIRDRHGRDKLLRLVDGGFLVEGRPCTLVIERTARPREVTLTASGSIAVPDAPARVARASRILVEGVHDAELVEKVWGADLRAEGVVVEYLEGVDHLPAVLAELRPAADARLGVLVDHLVPGSKESRIAEQVAGEHVLVVGHPYIDVWQAVRPERIGIRAWPEVPRGVEWKRGVCAALGWPHAEQADIARAWQRILGSVRSYLDLEPALLGPVERLIDFVTAPSEAPGH